MRVYYSKIESKRFNLNVYRGQVDHIYPNEITETILDNLIDVLIIRFPSDNQDDLIYLSETGFDYYVADTLVYYYADLEKQKIKNLQNTDLEVYSINTNAF